ncbi:MAG: glycosyltransferase family 2 protein, partial [Bacteriovorax sp.]
MKDPVYEKGLSILMTVYNGEKYLASALDSLLGQDFEDFELIVVDDASNDGSYNICSKYAENDARIKLYKNETNKGLLRNFNYSFSLANREYVMWADQDDLWESDFASSCLAEFGSLSNQELGLVATYANSFQSDASSNVINFVDHGFTTIGMSSAERIWKYRQELYGGCRVGGVFCGIWKTAALSKCMPANKAIAFDH